MTKAQALSPNEFRAKAESLRRLLSDAVQGYGLDHEYAYERGGSGGEWVTGGGDADPTGDTVADFRRELVRVHMAGMAEWMEKAHSQIAEHMVKAERIIGTRRKGFDVAQAEAVERAGRQGQRRVAAAERRRREATG